MNIYLNNIFHLIERTEIHKFADDTTPHSSHRNLNDAVTNVEHDCAILVKRFRDNFMTLNTEKFHLLVSGHKVDVVL